jgi:hypothetical protein
MEVILPTGSGREATGNPRDDRLRKRQPVDHRLREADSAGVRKVLSIFPDQQIPVPYKGVRHRGERPVLDSGGGPGEDGGCPSGLPAHLRHL